MAMEMRMEVVMGMAKSRAQLREKLAIIGPLRGFIFLVAVGAKLTTRLTPNSQRLRQLQLRRSTKFPAQLSSTRRLAARLSPLNPRALALTSLSFHQQL